MFKFLIKLWVKLKARFKRPNISTGHSPPLSVPPQAENSQDSPPAKLGWAILRDVLATIRDFSEPFPPLNASLSAVVVIMDSVQVRVTICVSALSR